MKMRFTGSSRLALLGLLCGLSLHARTFHLQDGSSINGEVASFKNGMVVISQDGGGKGLYTLDTFSEADQAYLREAFPGGNLKPEIKGTTTRATTSAPSPQPAKTATARNSQQSASPQSGHPGLKSLHAGSLPPELKARIQGQSDYQNLSDLRGKLVVVQFWSTQVAPSIEEVKGLAYLYSHYRNRGLGMMGVAMDYSLPRLNDIEEKIGVTWPMRMDEDRKTIEEWGVTALPTNVLIDENGVIVREHITARELMALLAQRMGPMQ